MVTASDATASRLDLIRNLLAKAEATPYPAEAEAFTAKATALMARHAIDEAMVWAHSPIDAGAPPTEIRLRLHRPFTAQKAVLVNSVANVFGCQAIRLGKSGDNSLETISVIGFPGDLVLVETLVTSLFLQLTSAMTAPDALTGRRGAGRTSASQVAAWRRSFIMGFTETVSARLAADHRRASDDADRSRASVPGNGRDQPSTSLVLRNRAAAVRDDVRVRYPHIRTSRVSSGTSEAGRRAGTSAGRTADLGSRRIGGRQALPSGG